MTSSMIGNCDAMVLLFLDIHPERCGILIEVVHLEEYKPIEHWKGFSDRVTRNVSLAYGRSSVRPYLFNGHPSRHENTATGFAHSQQHAVASSLVFQCGDRNA